MATKQTGVLQQYELSKKEVRNGHFTESMTSLLENIFVESLDTLNKFEKIELTSKVEGKKYIAFSNEKRASNDQGILGMFCRSPCVRQ